MTGFELPPLGIDLNGYQRSVLRAMAEQSANVQDPMRIAPNSTTSGELGAVGGAESGASFSGVLADSLSLVKGLQDDVRAKVRGLALGEDVELHDVMLAANKSETAMSLMLEVRNKLVDAWEKLSRSVV